MGTPHAHIGQHPIPGTAFLHIPKILSRSANIEDFPDFCHWFACRARKTGACPEDDRLPRNPGGRPNSVCGPGGGSAAARHPQLVGSALAYEETLQTFIHEQARKADEIPLEPYRELLDWFIAEQVEEVEQCKRILADIRRIGEDFTGLLILDRELRQRAA